MKESDNLDRILFEWEHADFYTVRNSLQSALIIGETGSAKTTSSFSLLAKYYLLKGYGILALTCKEEETKKWREMCKAYGREDDLVVFGPNSDQYYNFFGEELDRKDSGKGIVHNIADVLKTVIKAGSQEGGESDKAFWDSSLQQLLVNTVDLCDITKNKKFEHIYEIVKSAPRSKEQLESDKWRSSSKCFLLIQHIAKILQDKRATPQIEKLANRLHRIEDFFLGSWVRLSEKTRSIVEQMFFGFADSFMRDPVYSLMCDSKTTVKPEDTIKGRIIVIDMPIMIYDKTGKDVQILWKYLWQRAMQRRKISAKSRPCALFVDEFQYFFSDKDPQFQSTSRSYRACSVYVTQNLPNFYLNAGLGELGKTRFKALAGNISTKIFHANTDPETNLYASDLIGKDWGWTSNKGQTMGDGFSLNTGHSESFEYIVDPTEFTKLKTGGPENNFMAEAIIHRQGKIFRSTGYNYKKKSLKQIFI